jgi:hypothetical protein
VGVLIWALVSLSCRETVELYLDYADAVADVPDWIDELAVVSIELDDAGSGVCLN